MWRYSRGRNRYFLYAKKGRFGCIVIGTISSERSSTDTRRALFSARDASQMWISRWPKSIRRPSPKSLGPSLGPISSEPNSFAAGGVRIYGSVYSVSVYTKPATPEYFHPNFFLSKLYIHSIWQIQSTLDYPPPSGPYKRWRIMGRFELRKILNYRNPIRWFWWGIARVADNENRV